MRPFVNINFVPGTAPANSVRPRVMKTWHLALRGGDALTAQYDQLSKT
jgi:hypothetical protein